MPLDQDTFFMEQALEEGRKAYAQNEVPVGAVMVAQERIVARAYNRSEALHDVTAHAELIALTALTQYYGTKYLPECTLYVTLEPCPMCAGALRWVQLGRLVYAASDPKGGCMRHTPTLLHPKTKITSGVLSAEAARLLEQFFRKRR